MTTGHANGRVAVVTGTSRGIGRAFAERLAADGAAVAIVDLESGDETLTSVRELGAHALSVRADVSDEASVSRVYQEVVGELGDVDILVNNVGIGRVEALEDITLASWRQLMAVNLDSMFLTCRAFMPGMRERGWGRVVNVASNTVGLVIPWGFSHYIASKGGVLGLTRALASEFGAHGVTVNAISPGLTRTPATAEMMRERFDYYVEEQPVKRSGMPDDLAGALGFLVSDDAAFMTGQNLIVDGGLLRA